MTCLTLLRILQLMSTAYFADDTKIFRCVDSIPDAAVLQSDLCNPGNCSSTSGINFNVLKCKYLRVSRKNQPITYPYMIKGKELTTTSVEKELGVWIASDLTWNK
jgi:hypothetical protein